jgi:uncharacterized protein
MKKVLFTICLLLGMTGAAFAQSYDLKTITPEVKSALEARKARFSELKAFKAQGILGESNRGYVQALGGGADVKALVNAENADRREVYQAIVEQNDLGAGALATVEGVFAGVQREKAAAGEKVQDPSGDWMTK